jgi:hypothetical protein
MLPFSLAVNFEISERGVFCGARGNRVLPIAANIWFKSQSDGGSLTRVAGVVARRRSEEEAVLYMLGIALF